MISLAVLRCNAGRRVGGVATPVAVAVEATNAAQPVPGDYDLNLVTRQSDDREPMDLDTLNTPAGKCVGVFLAALPNINKGEIRSPAMVQRVRCVMRLLRLLGSRD